MVEFAPQIFFYLGQRTRKYLVSFIDRMKLMEAYDIGISKIISCYKGLPMQPKYKNVEEVLGLGTTHAVNTLKEMLEKELIKKVGSGRLTRYVVK